MKDLTKRVLLGLDLWMALGLGLVAWRLGFKGGVSMLIAKELFGMGLTVLSIVFAVYFTALSIIISAGDDDFIGFLAELSIYEKLVNVYRFTLWLLFVALLASGAFYLVAVLSPEHAKAPGWLMAIFIWLSTYGLFSTMSSTRDSLQFATRRVQWLRIKEQQKSKG